MNELTTHRVALHGAAGMFGHLSPTSIEPQVQHDLGQKFALPVA